MMAQLSDMYQSTGGAVLRKRTDQYKRNVNLLKNGDFRRIDGHVYMPTDSEISTLRKTQPGQFRKGVEFSASMSEGAAKKKLEETFPYLENTSFVCAAVVKLDKEHKKLEFYGPPRLWNGETIRKKITGNSALYILEDEVPDSKTELNATKMPLGDDDVASNIAMNVNQMSLRDEMEINENHQESSSDESATVQQISYSSGEGTSSIDGASTSGIGAEVSEGDDDVASSIATNVNQMSLRDDSQMEIDENPQESSSDESATVQQISYSSGEGTSSIDGASTSGIGAEVSEEDLSLLQWAEENVHYQVSVNPEKSPLEGGAPCCFRFNPKLQPDVTSGRATFGNLGAVELERSTNGSLFGNSIPASPKPGWVPIIVESQDGKILGQTEIYYEDPVEYTLQQLLFDPSLQKRLFDKYMFMRLGGNLQTSSAEGHQSETLGLKQPVEMLSLLVCAAAERGAQQFLDMIFTSSAGRIIFEAYKDGLTLPEVIAKDHGNELTVHYLQSVTNRFSKDIKTGKECSQTIDWSELVKAAEEAQNRLDVISKELNYQIERDLLKETGYLGDDETSSSESSELHYSDSEDDISRTSWKETQAKAEEWKKPDLENGNHANGANETSLTQSPILFLKDGEIHSERANVKTFHFHETKPHKWKEDGLLLIQSIYIQEAHNLRQLKSLHRSGNSFFLGLSNEPVNHNLITSYQRLIHLLKLTKERNARCKMQVDTAEARQSSENLSAILGNKDDHNTDIVDLLQQLYCRVVTKDYTATANNVDLTAGRKSAKWLMEHCQSAASNFWVLTYAFRPTREILFFYVADNKDVLLLTSCTDDKEYELSWHRCRNNVPKVQETDSSFGDSSSDVSWQTSGEHPGCRGKRRPVVKKTYSTINVVNNSAPVAVGGKRANITDEQNRDQPSTCATQPLDNSSSEVVNPEIPEETITEVVENCPGSHYPRRQEGKKGRKRNTKPSKVIMYRKGDATYKWSIKEFLESPEKFIHEMDNNACSLQEEKEDFILHEILPYLDESWGKCFSSKEKIYEILGKISCSRKSAKVVRQALQLLLHFIYKDNFESYYENLLVVEAVIRSSILSPEGLFKTDRNSEQELKLYVYSRILSSLVIQQVRKEELRIETLKQDLKKLHKELERFGNQLDNKKKDSFRYLIEFILEAIWCLLKPQEKLKELLDECQEFCSNQQITSGELKVVQGLRRRGKWIDFHCILIYLHGLVYCERPVPQMETERRAMKLFRLLVEKYLKKDGGDDWRFCSLASSILSDITMNNVTKEEFPRDDPPPLELPISHTSYVRPHNCADDLPTRYLGPDGPLVKERITCANKQHHCPFVEMISSDALLGNLKEYVLDRRCQKSDISMFLFQVSSALHYYHENHVVHGDLRAECVNVLAPNKIQVARLGRSKSLPKRADEVTSTSCVIQSSMPPDSTRWSSPEVILQNNYSHASDVWAFGILAWELYTAFATGQERKGYSVPYCDLVIDEILPHIRNKGPLAKPEGCPDWVYIIMHQCWTYDPVQRPPFIAIFECLTCRQPMKSWMMSLWLKNHEKSEWPDLSISQPEDACHVSIRDENHFERAIEEMCSEGFFTVHGYKYVQWDDAKAERVQDELYDDVDWKNCTQSASDLQAEELYDYVLPSYQLRSGCNFRRPKELPDSNAFSVDPRYKNVEVDLTKTDLLEEEAYDDVRSTNGVVYLKDVSTEPRYQNVMIRITNTAVDMPEVPGDNKTYEGIGNHPPALCHSAGTDEHSKDFLLDSSYLYISEDYERKTSDLEEDLYEEIPGAVISNSVKGCGSKSPESSDFNRSSEEVDCVEFTTNAENGSVVGKGKEQIHDDAVYAETGSLQLADMRLNRYTGSQSTTGVIKRFNKEQCKELFAMIRDRKNETKISPLGDEWCQAQQLAQQLAQQRNVPLTFRVPEYDRKEEQAALKHNVYLVIQPVDVVIRHCMKLGPPANIAAKRKRCTGVHIVHTFSEKIAMHKNETNAIADGRRKPQTEADLSKAADVVVDIGRKLTENFKVSLRRYRKDVLNITTGIFSEFSGVPQASEELVSFSTLVFGRGNYEDFELKGYDIAAQAVAGLNDNTYKLIFVGAPEGEEVNVKNHLLKFGISPNQVTVQRFRGRRNELVVRQISPSCHPGQKDFALLRSKLFLLAFLLIRDDNSGLGKTLAEIPFGASAVVDSDEPEEWGEAIRRVRKKRRRRNTMSSKLCRDLTKTETLATFQLKDTWLRMEKIDADYKKRT